MSSSSIKYIPIKQSSDRHKTDRQDNDPSELQHQAKRSKRFSHRSFRSRPRSSGSSSPSDYSSSDSAESSARDNLSESSISTRLSSNASHVLPAKRRLAIVQENSSEPSFTDLDRTSRNSSLRSRRGVTSPMADVYANNTFPSPSPPATAPITSENQRTAINDQVPARGQDKGHSRSVSDLSSATPRKRSSRDIGIVGIASVKGSHHSLGPPIFQRPRSRSRSISNKSDASNPEPFMSAAPDHEPPPTTLYTTDSVATTPSTLLRDQDNATTTEILTLPSVAVNVATNVTPLPIQNASEKSSKTNSMNIPPVTPELTPYLHYKPGVHATAGPLPPPPRAMFAIDTNTPPPPRPPRILSPTSSRPRGDIEAVKQALQLPASVTAALGSRSAASSAESLSSSKPRKEESSETPRLSSHGHHLVEAQASHRREGAFSPSTSSACLPTSSSESSVLPTPQQAPEELATVVNHVAEEIQVVGDVDIPDDDASPMITIIQPPPRFESLKAVSESDHDDGDNWVKVSRELTPSPEPRQSLSFEPPSPTLDRSTTFASRRDHLGTPSPPPKGFRNSITTNLKRFSSLPRTPTSSTRSANRRSTSSSTQLSSRTPSPLGLPKTPTPPPRKKIRSQQPSAMFCSEVASRKTTLERCAVYAQKINELYIYDCGLGDWVLEARFRGSNGNSVQASLGRSHPGFFPQPRHPSRASMHSEATFPFRPDASTATDLSSKSQDFSPPTAIPAALPYPSLATHQQRAYPPRTSSASGHLSGGGTPPGSMRTLVGSPSFSASSKTGFFASLGRRSSMSKRDKNAPALGTRPSTSTGAGAGGRTVLGASNNTNNVGGGGIEGGGGGAKTASILPRPLNISGPTPPTPSGPRAPPPSRLMRSQTIMTTPSAFHFDKNGPLGRRPSLFNISASTSSLNVASEQQQQQQQHQSQPLQSRQQQQQRQNQHQNQQQQQQQQQPVIDIRPDPEFVRQVDKLAELLPHADRDILGGYLRRAGQDILAIGQYLEDEKNGTLRV